MKRARLFEVVHVVSKGGAYDEQALPPYQHRHLPGPATTGWKSPVPYLFGGLAAMLGLIAFALLILACSYWKLSGHMDGDNSGDDAGDGEEKVKAAEDKAAMYANSILVIMAGEEKPTFLATPATSRTTSFGDSDGIPTRTCSCSIRGCGGGGGDGGDVEERHEVQLTMTTTSTQKEPDHVGTST